MITTKNVTTCIDLILDGGVGVLPTDTVYGIVGRADDKAVAQRLYELKPRGAKPGTLVAASIDQLANLGLKRRYLTAVAHFWPGPVSVIIPSDDSLEYLHLGLNGLATRIPSDTRMQSILQQTGPLITTSANHPGAPTAVTIDEAKQYFGDQVDFYLDGGNLSDQKPSTVVRIIDDAIEVLRQGAVNINEKGEILQ